MKKYSLSKSEKLKSRTLINGLFQQGKSVFLYPLKLIYYPIPEDYKGISPTSPVLFSVTVPRRQYKKAVTRNLIKRHIREHYRLNKSDLTDYVTKTTNKLALMYIYVGKSAEDISILPSAMPQINKKLLRQLKTQ